MHVLCAYAALACFSHRASPSRETSIYTTPRNTHADLEQTLNCETACSYRLRWLWTACERSADIPPSLYQASNICLRINCLRPTCYQAIITPRNSWLDVLRQCCLYQEFHVLAEVWIKGTEAMWFMHGEKRFEWREKASGCVVCSSEEHVCGWEDTASF